MLMKMCVCLALDLTRKQLQLQDNCAREGRMKKNMSVIYGRIKRYLQYKKSTFYGNINESLNLLCKLQLYFDGWK